MEILDWYYAMPVRYTMVAFALVGAALMVYFNVGHRQITKYDSVRQKAFVITALIMIGMFLGVALAVYLPVGGVFVLVFGTVYTLVYFTDRTLQ